MKRYYKAGSWNSLCDRCGFEYKSDQLKKEWAGLMVCGGCFETRHPQTLIRVPREDSAIPWARPEATDIFIGPQELQLETDITQFIDTESGFDIFTEG